MADPTPQVEYDANLGELSDLASALRVIEARRESERNAALRKLAAELPPNMRTLIFEQNGRMEVDRDAETTLYIAGRPDLVKRLEDAAWQWDATGEGLDVAWARHAALQTRCIELFAALNPA